MERTGCVSQSSAWKPPLASFDQEQIAADRALGEVVPNNRKKAPRSCTAKGSHEVLWGWLVREMCILHRTKKRLTAALQQFLCTWRVSWLTIHSRELEILCRLYAIRVAGRKPAVQWGVRSAGRKAPLCASDNAHLPAGAPPSHGSVLPTHPPRTRAALAFLDALAEPGWQRRSSARLSSGATPRFPSAAPRPPRSGRGSASPRSALPRSPSPW